MKASLRCRISSRPSSPQLLDGGNAQEHHGAGHFGSEQLQDVGHSGLARGRQTVEVGPADGAGVGAEGEGLDDVGAAADAAVDDDFEPALRPVDDVREYVQGRGHVVQLPAAVVADLDGVDADLGRDDGVVGVDQPLRMMGPFQRARRSRMSSQSVGS